jgi:hypothetical protein
VPHTVTIPNSARHFFFQGPVKVNVTMISGNALAHQEVESAIILMLWPISWKYSATVIPDGKRYNTTVNRNPVLNSNSFLEYVVTEILC